MARLGLVLIFVVLPIAEIYLLIQIGHAIGAGPTVLLLLADAVLGSWLIRREAIAAFRAVNHMLNQGRMPTTELADGALVVFGGALLLAPGFLTDILGLFLIAPLTRPLARRALSVLITRKVVVLTSVSSPGRSRSQPDQDVVVGEVIEDR